MLAAWGLLSAGCPKPGAAASLTAQPADLTVEAGASATFSAAAAGDAPLAWQWQRREPAGATFEDVAGAVAASYTLASAPAAASGAQFRVRVSNAALPGGVLSRAATLTVNVPPATAVVPSLAGLTRAAAEAAIVAAHLAVGAETSTHSNAVPAGSVISQDPPAGATVLQGSPVALVLSSGPADVIVPDLTGLTQAAADAALLAAHLSVGAVSLQPSATVPAGKVIEQHPAAGASAPPGSTVDLVVSSGPPPVLVPSLVGLAQAAAEAAIVAASLAVGAETSARSATVPAGAVLSQDPAAGASVPPGTAVALVISSGPPDVLVPDLTGLAQAAAEAALAAANLVEGAVSHQRSAEVPAGKVISQDPAAGSSVRPGSAVALVVSSGPPDVLVPDVTGLTEAGADAALLAAHLAVGPLTVQASPTVPAGAVISQDPAAGAAVPPGTAVALVLSSGPAYVDTSPPVWPVGAQLTLLAVDGSSATVGWPAADDDVAVAEYRIRLDGAQVATVSGAHLDWKAAGLAWGVVHQVEVRAADAVGNESAPGPRGSVAALPPDPATVAPPLDRTRIATFDEQVSFLWEGANALQVGVAPGAIQPARVAVVKGRVLDPSGAPLPGALVRVLDHPELGNTVSRADGGYDLAVNGGGGLVLRFERAGRLGAQRLIDTGWHDTFRAPDVALLPRDPAVTAVELPSAAVQVARASPVHDADGDRRATLVFPPGVVAQAVLPDGSRQPLPVLHARATEYTVGASGQAAMPATLPPTSAYTYALELTADEAEAAGATGVEFSAPVSLLYEEFLGVPVGNAIPAGYYDRAAGVWRGAPDGVVAQVLAVSGGVAAIDADGDGLADSDASLDGHGIGAAARAAVASLYVAGQRFSHVPVQHFSAWDPNHSPNLPPPPPPPPSPMGPAGGGGGGPQGGGRDPDGCEQAGSIIVCSDQVLEERLPIAGTPLSLRYASDRGPGRTEAFTRTFQITGPTLPTTEPPFTLNTVTWQIEVAGQVYSGSSTPTPNLAVTFTWDGRDAYGRRVGGTPLATVTIGYDYEFYYDTYPYRMGTPVGRFGLVGIEGRPPLSPGNPTLVPGRSGFRATRSVKTSVRLGTRDAVDAGLGGWELDAVHVFDRERGLVSLGSGAERPVGPFGRLIERAAGALDGGYPSAFPIPDGPAADARLLNPTAVAAAPDGTVFVAIGDKTVRRIDLQGMMVRVAGTPTSSSFSGDGGPALSAALGAVQDLAVGRDGTLFVLTDGRIRSVGPDGVIRTIAGVGYNACNRSAPVTAGTPLVDCNDPTGGLNGPAAQARLDGVQSIATGPDGSLFLADYRSNQIRRVTPGGMLTAYAGNGQGGAAIPPEGAVASAAALGAPQWVRAAADGSVFFTDAAGVLYQISPQGRLSARAGAWYSPCTTGPCGDEGPANAARFSGLAGLALGRDGTVYVVDRGFGPGRVRQLDTDGLIRTTAGGSAACANNGPCGDGGKATAAALYYPTALTQAADGRLWLIDGNKLRRVTASSPSLRLGEFVVPSEDGREAWIFDGAGRHQRTLDALTGVALWTFGFDAQHRLTSLTDRDGNVTQVVRNGGGDAVAIVAPGGQATALALDASGLLATVTAPEGDAVHLGYDASGLLTSLVEPGGGAHAFTWAAGRLVRDDGPAGRSAAIAQQQDGTRRTVTFTSAEGRTTSYLRELLPAGDHSLRTDPAGAVTEKLVTPDGTSVTTLPDGTVTTLSYVPDPRWGWSVPQVGRLRVQTPAGLVREVSVSSSAAFAVPADPLSLTAYSEQTTVGGAVWRTDWDVASRRRTWRSPDGTVETVDLDARGRPAHQAKGAPFAPVDFTWTAAGLLQQQSAGAEHLTLGWDAALQPSSIEDASGARLSFTHDGNGRLLGATTQEGPVWSVAWDAAGNQATLALPGLAAPHAFSWDGAHEGIGWSRPSGDAQAWASDRDGLGAGIALPSGRTVAMVRAASGRLLSEATPEATVAFTYADGTARPAGLVRTPASIGAAQSLAWLYDGAVVTRAVFSGAAAGTFDYAHAANGRLSQIALSGTDSALAALTYAPDGRRAGYGPFAYDRQGPAGTLRTISDGNHTVTYTPDAQNRLVHRTDVVNGVTLYDVQVTYDAAGRVAAQVETVAGTSTLRAFTRDGQRRLASVLEGGNASEAYRWSARGDRLGRTLGAAAEEVSTFDDDDRLLARGATAYTFDRDGMLAARGADTFAYGARGELLRAVVGGQAVTYEYDGFGRRTRRTGPDGTTEYLYGDPEQMLQVTHVRDGQGLASLWYDDFGRLIALERGGVRYAVATDLAGTPRAVAAPGGAVVEVIDRDTFGVLRADSNPAFGLPIGFAGGVDDRLTGFSRLGLRDYDPDLGRFTTLDPTLFGGGSLNLYAYASGDPATFRDPTGLWAYGVSLHSGVGGGIRLSHDERGWSLCGNLGFGEGLFIDFAPKAPRDRAGISARAQGTIALGPFVADVSVTHQFGTVCPAPDRFEGHFGPGPGAVLRTVQERANVLQEFPLTARIMAQYCGSW